MNNHGGMISTEKNPSVVHRSCLAIPPAVIWQQAGGTGEGNEFWPFELFLFTLKSDLYMP
jgi:hypothetical protein